MVGEQRAPRERERGVTLNMRDDSIVHRYWDAISNEGPINRGLRRALSRFVRARAAYFAEDAIVHTIIGVEAMFGDATHRSRGESKKVIRRAAAFMLDPDSQPTVAELEELQNKLEQLYAPRHIILHGGLMEEANPGALARSGIQLLQTLICIALEEGFDRMLDLDALPASFDQYLRAARRREKVDRRKGSVSIDACRA